MCNIGGNENKRIWLLKSFVGLLCLFFDTSSYYALILRNFSGILVVNCVLVLLRASVDLDPTVIYHFIVIYHLYVRFLQWFILNKRILWKVSVFYWFSNDNIAADRWKNIPYDTYLHSPPFISIIWKRFFLINWRIFIIYYCCKNFFPIWTKVYICARY